MDPNSITAAFGINLRQKRKAAGLTQTQLAEKLDYSPKAISKWESGKAIAPAALLPQLARLLHTTVDSLLRVELTPTYFLGIDGGGTKTEFVLCNGTGDPIAQTKLGGSNPNDIGIENTLQLVSRGIETVCGEIPFSRISVFAGIAGCSVSNHKKTLLAHLRHYGFAGADCGSDAQNAVEAALQGRDGVVIIAGTGNAAFVRKNGSLTRIGGYNYLFDEGGSGYKIGRDALLHAMKCEDFGLAKGPMYESVIAKCGTETVFGYIAELYKGGKTLIASFAPLVFNAYDLGDQAAEEILRTNAKVIAEEMEAGAKMLGQKEPKIALIGGLTKRADILLPMINAHLKTLRQPDVFVGAPVEGALRLAGLEK
ncbi:MAG: XRE family transcriptional regulator [Clostridia bacterium]|nr:XRE family transcriptional regulator [Clostridia bacterium]